MVQWATHLFIMELLDGSIEDFDVSDSNSADPTESDHSDESESFDGTLSGGSDLSDHDSTPEPQQQSEE